jgi:nicotinate-nucleotide adenylyltransferase
MESIIIKHSPSAMRLGLLGGSFNPIHFGHLGIARDAREKLGLDRVVFIPSGTPPHKQDKELAPAKDRYEMVRLAIAGTDSFDLSDFELRRGGKSYSIDTVRELQQHYGSSTDLYFLIGLDAFLDFPTWREPAALLRACRFVVISRPGQSYRSLAGLPMLPPLAPDLLAQLDSREVDRLDIPLPSGPGIICLPLPPCPISASDIRRRIRDGMPRANLLPPPVESYILHHRLYQEDPDHTHI